MLLLLGGVPQETMDLLPPNPSSEGCYGVPHDKRGLDPTCRLQNPVGGREPGSTSGFAWPWGFAQPAVAEGVPAHGGGWELEGL